MRWIERSLILGGLLLLCVWGGLRLDALAWRLSAARRLDAVPARETATIPSTDRPPSPVTGEGEPLGRIVIPRVGVEAIIAEGTSEATLRRAVGHVHGTALPGQSGNAALAAHRDGLFRPLRGIRTGDRVEVITPRARYAYRVAWARVVEPTRVDLIAPTPQPSLTLVTCYPWHYLGHAPKRFLVRADLVPAAGPPAGRPAGG
jgi:sortase A